jgi:hypothetical protein
VNSLRDEKMIIGAPETTFPGNSVEEFFSFLLASQPQSYVELLFSPGASSTSRYGSDGPSSKSWSGSSEAVWALS